MSVRLEGYWAARSDNAANRVECPCREAGSNGRSVHLNELRPNSGLFFKPSRFVRFDILLQPVQVTQYEIQITLRGRHERYIRLSQRSLSSFLALDPQRVGLLLDIQILFRESFTLNRELLTEPICLLLDLEFV